MSYCRMSARRGEESDVYAIHAVDGYRCLWCAFGERTLYHSPRRLRAHLIRHQLEGDAVPQDALDRLAKEAVAW